MILKKVKIKQLLVLLAQLQMEGEYMDMEMSVDPPGISVKLSKDQDFPPPLPKGPEPLPPPDDSFPKLEDLI